MQFQVPQFIEVEDKIFGPLTLKQFIYVAGGVGVVIIFWSVMPLFWAIVLGTPVLALTAALAFYQVNGKPLIEVIEASIRYAFGRKLYIWEKREPKPGARPTEDAKKAQEMISVPKLSGSTLKDLAWNLDVQESLYAGEAQEQQRRARSHMQQENTGSRR